MICYICSTEITCHCPKVTSTTGSAIEVIVQDVLQENVTLIDLCPPCFQLVDDLDRFQQEVNFRQQKIASLFHTSKLVCDLDLDLLLMMCPVDEDINRKYLSVCCGKVFRKLQDKFDHLRKSHLEALNGKVNLVLGQLTSSSSQHIAQFPCDFCPKQFETWTEIILHVRNAHSETIKWPQICIICQVSNF